MGLSAYEQERLSNIAANDARLRELGLSDVRKPLPAPAARGGYASAPVGARSRGVRRAL